jgi:hypothetical protein
MFGMLTNVEGGRMKQSQIRKKMFISVFTRAPPPPLLFVLRQLNWVENIPEYALVISRIWIFRYLVIPPPPLVRYIRFM